jgi:hypothetical protein
MSEAGDKKICDLAGKKAIQKRYAITIRLKAVIFCKLNDKIIFVNPPHFTFAPCKF